jgi:hypothetical protein
MCVTLWEIAIQCWAVCTVGFFFAGCPCCSVGAGTAQCGACRNLVAPAEITVTLAGITGTPHGFCDNCNSLNGTFVLAAQGGPSSHPYCAGCYCCTWTGSFVVGACTFHLQAIMRVCPFPGGHNVQWLVWLGHASTTAVALEWGEPNRIVAGPGCGPGPGYTNTTCLDDCCAVSGKILPWRALYSTPSCQGAGSTATITSGPC